MSELAKHYREEAVRMRSLALRMNAVSQTKTLSSAIRYKAVVMKDQALELAEEFDDCAMKEDKLGRSQTQSS